MDQLSDQFTQLNLNGLGACPVCLGTVQNQINKAQWFRSRKIAYRLTRRKLDREKLGQAYNLAFLPLCSQYTVKNLPGDTAINSISRKTLARLMYHSYIRKTPFTQFGSRDVYFEEVSDYLYGKIKVNGNNVDAGSICDKHRCPSCTGIKSQRKLICWRCKRFNDQNSSQLL